MNFQDLPKAIRDKRLTWLKCERERGVPLSQFSQEDRDLLHMETSWKNVEYWKAENECAKTDERAYFCQDIARNIICTLRALEPVVDDEHPLADVLCNAMEEAANLPAVHK